MTAIHDPAARVSASIYLEDSMHCPAYELLTSEIAASEKSARVSDIKDRLIAGFAAEEVRARRVEHVFGCAVCSEAQRAAARLAFGMSR